MAKPKTLNIYVHVIMQSHCEPLFITHWWYGFVVTLFVCLFVRTYDLDILPLNYYAHVIKESHRPHLRISSERSIPLPLDYYAHVITESHRPTLASLSQTSKSITSRSVP